MSQETDSNNFLTFDFFNPSTLYSSAKEEEILDAQQGNRAKMQPNVQHALF